MRPSQAAGQETLTSKVQAYFPQRRRLKSTPANPVCEENAHGGEFASNGNGGIAAHLHLSRPPFQGIDINRAERFVGSDLALQLSQVYPVGSTCFFAHPAGRKIPLHKTVHCLSELHGSPPG